MKMILALIISISSVAFAAPSVPAPEVVKKAAVQMKQSDVRTVIKQTENVDGNPCMAEGKSFNVELQVKTVQGYNHEKHKVVYKWETVKTVNVSNDGEVMEVCAE